MKRIVYLSLTIVLFFLLFGCASTYQRIYPHSINYTAHNIHDGISISYKYDVLFERGNTKYARKERKKRIKILAVKLTNNTDTLIRLYKDVEYFSGDRQIFPMEPIALKNSIKQSVVSYLPYLLLTFFNIYVTIDDNTTTYPVGLVIGPGITFGNMIVAAAANDNMYREFTDHCLMHKTVNKGETVYGIIGFRDIDYNTFSVRLIKK